MELLSPAGSFDALKAAVCNGADAVYFGGSLFNARLGAQNFDRDEMTDALAFCHTNGVKAYITMNTLTHDRDIRSAVEYAAFLYEHGADALIIQDLGLFSLIKKYIPDFELHASTQMCISSIGGVKACEKLGFDRVVLSRELSLADIAHIHRHSDMPLEVFVHGAMCMSFSGGCLFSSMVGGRSGNCGTCAQPCRKYAAIDHIPSKEELALSLSDLCMIENIPDLEKAGAYSLKIEGRMKKPEYIASVTHAYRRAMDGADAEEIAELKREMAEVFSRGGFATGYYFGDNAHTGCIALASPSAETLAKIHSRPDCTHRHNIKMHLTIKPHEPSSLHVESDFANFTVEGEKAAEAKNAVTETTVQRYAEQLRKLGGTAFQAEEVTADIDGFLPISAVNDLRRQAVRRLEENFLPKRQIPKIPENIRLSQVDTAYNKPKIIARVMNMEQAQAAVAADADEIVLEYGEFTEDEIQSLQYIRNGANGKRLLLGLPIALIGETEDENLHRNISTSDFDGIEINNPGQLEYARNFEHITGGMHLNVFNAYTARLFLDEGVERLTISPELNPPQLHEIQSYVQSSALTMHVYGRVPLMNLYHCPIKEYIGCKKCAGRMHYLFDAEGRKFPIVGTQKKHPCSVVRLYNCYPHDILPRLNDVKNINKSLNFTTEDAATVKNRICAVKKGVGEALPNTTRGYFKR